MRGVGTCVAGRRYVMAWRYACAHSISAINAAAAGRGAFFNQKSGIIKSE